MAVPIAKRFDDYPDASSSQATADATPVVLTAATANYFMIPGTSVIFDIFVHVHNSDGAGTLLTAALFQKRGCYKQLAGGVDCVQVGAVFDVMPACVDPALFGVDVELRVGQDGPKIWITGLAATLLYWGVAIQVSRFEGAG